MVPSNTICVSQEGPANALALNKDCSQVVIAGRNVFKVFAIGEDEFTEVCNLRVGKNLNLNFSSIDVAWSTFEENTLATAATNGAVVVWNLGRSGRSKQEHVFSDHKRTVNKVSFHLTEPSLLVSGSQDGMMKCFDLRIKEVARTFISNTESIRDVQFSPLSQHTFAAVSENGSAQLWDVRRHERPLSQFTAHSGPVFACDWHPQAPWLATASRDKTIKVWDTTSAKPTLEYTIYTIASVGNVKWRPQKKYQVASCALVLDCAVHVWDVRRPHLPLATFAEHRDVTTALRWQSSTAFLACSRDCGLYRHRWGSAAHPLLWANPHAVALSPAAVLASAVPCRPLPLPHVPNVATTAAVNDSHVPRLGLGSRKQPTAGSLTPVAQAALERAFPVSAASVLARHRPPQSHADPVIGCAKHYRIHGLSPHDLAQHNAEVATKYQRHLVAHVWSVVVVWLAAVSGGGGGLGGAGGPTPPAAPPPPPPSPPPPPDPPLEPDEWPETCFHNSGVLGKPTHSIYIPPVRRANAGANDEDAGWISAASQHYVDLDAADWTLPEEAFPLRQAPPVHPHPHTHIGGNVVAQDDIDGATQLMSDGSGAVAVAAGGVGVGSSGPSPSSSPSSQHTRDQPTFTHHTSMHQVENGSTGGANGSNAIGGHSRLGLGVGVGVGVGVASLVAGALRLHADLGDVQTAAVVLLALHDRRNEVLTFIEESLQEQWLLGYIELLQRHQLWNQATEVIRWSWVSSVWSISQQSTAVTLACGRCGRRMRAPSGRSRGCDRCAQQGVTGQGMRCAVCRQMVWGLYAWCQGCAHGGHLHHLQSWLQVHQLCPAGCGHRCQLP